MSNENLFTIHLLIFCAYCAALWGSSLAALAVRYVTDGDKDINRLSTWIAVEVLGQSDYYYSKREYSRISTSDIHFGATCVLAMLLFINCAVTSVLDSFGILHFYFVTIGAALAVVGLLKIARLSYRVKVKLDKHINDSSKHK